MCLRTTSPAVAEREGATPYDVPGVELGQRGDQCSFDAIVYTYDLEPESRGLLAIARAFSPAYADDHTGGSAMRAPQRVTALPARAANGAVHCGTAVRAGTDQEDDP